MIQNIGCDILSIDRFKNIFDKFPSFLNKVYSKNEIMEYHRRNDDITYLASRFCAKEAIFKALKSYDHDFNTIEVLNGPDNNPVVNFLNGENFNVMISISYETDYVISFAIISIIN